MGAGNGLKFAHYPPDVDEAPLVRCSVRGQAAALSELRRVLRPTGKLHLYAHVLTRDRRVAGLRRDTTFCPRVAGGCHAARDTVAAIAAAGFVVEPQERFAFRPSALLPAVPHILGAARNP